MKDRFIFRKVMIESVALRPSCNFHGTREELKSLMDVVTATRVFESVLMDDSKTLEQITEALKRKHVCARNFEHTFNIVWPL